MNMKTKMNEYINNEKDLLLIRVVYGKKSTPTKDREYQIDGRGPVGTIVDFKKYFPTKNFKVFENKIEYKRKINAVEIFYEKEVGLKYLEVLKHISKIRKSRREKYKDSFLKSSVDKLLLQAEIKIDRFKDSTRLDDDDLLDACNYLIFSIIVWRRKNE